ncbi:hypothetical protein DSO57_1015961 [Entomophthora muscae]|uniref:Uncharacterized protein n=1 Tax=Entomophthora muscae TaxID=34485 RepID=A0ACC2T4Z9_9FUNG|nr:hypothetical protein DSO57_1015961 [Entomophthora muscae]
MDSKCKDVMHTFYLITRFLENALILKGQINVSAKYLWTLDGMPWKSTKTLGFVSPRSYLVDQVNGGYFYPSAVLRQLGDKSIDKDSVDMTISINPNVNFYFPSMFGQSQESNQIGAIDVIAHELLHGTGFATFFRSEANSNISPVIQVLNPGQYGRSKMNFDISIFEKFIYTQEGDSVASLVEQMGLCGTVQNPSARDGKKLLSNCHLYLTKKIEMFATKPGGLVFRTKDEDIYLETSEDPLVKGTSISHLELGYRETDDMII